MQIIHKRTIVEDDYLRVPEDKPLADGDILISLLRFRENQEALSDRTGRIGVEIPNDILAEGLVKELAQVDMIAIDFPIYRDGRGFSSARIFRRSGFTGELRATGNVLRDQIAFMERCGFDTYEVQAGKNIQDALEGFEDFTVSYQDAHDARTSSRS